MLPKMLAYIIPDFYTYSLYWNYSDKIAASLQISFKNQQKKLWFGIIGLIYSSPKMLSDKHLVFEKIKLL